MMSSMAATEQPEFTHVIQRRIDHPGGPASQDRPGFPLLRKLL
jgi:hypothetical protein